MHSIKHCQDVVDWGLCVGCGACYSVCTKKVVLLENIESVGIRPKFKKEFCLECRDCLIGCPGYCVDARRDEEDLGDRVSDNLLIGRTIEVWEGYAADEGIRYRASSGGLLTALALYSLEKENMKFVLHTGMHPEKPWKNITVKSRTRDELLAQAGSRYIVSSPCDSLKLIEDSDRPCVFIGKPCDVSAVAALRKTRPNLDANLGLVLTFFCAGTPSTRATLDLLEKLDVPSETIKGLYYRGNGWPGGFAVLDEDGKREQLLPYMESWSFLQKYRAFRCHLCPDGMGELGDISCGDAWHRYDKDREDPGLSLAMVRSLHGKQILHRAMDAGYVELKPSSPINVVKAQQLVERRMEIFGRQLAMKLLFIPTTRFLGFSLFKCWLKAPVIVKIKSIFGTLRRLLQRGLWHRNPV